MSRPLRILAAALACALFGARACLAASALAVVAPPGAAIVDRHGDVVLTVPMSQAVPWKLALADDPPRLVVDFGELLFSEDPGARSDAIASVSTGQPEPGWSRLTALLREPLEIGSAEMETAADGTATLEVVLKPTTADAFRSAIAAEADTARPEPHPRPALPVIALDAGHGGFDPGAEVGGLVEADLTLAFARRLKEELLRTGRFGVVLTRDEDSFVPLDERLTRAHNAGAAVFISLHADTLPEDAGNASGVTVYTLDPAASGEASELLAERHSGADIIGGADLSGAGEDVAIALLDLARLDTQPRTAALSAALIGAFRAAELAVSGHPERQAELAVLKAADMPSVLIELGFLSSTADRARLASDKWQDEAARAVRNALLIWEDEDRLRRDAMRR